MRKSRTMNSLLVILFFVTLGLAVLGWHDVLSVQTANRLANKSNLCATPNPSVTQTLSVGHIGDVLYLSVSAFLFSDHYAQSAEYCADPRIQIARWTGLFVAISALIKAGLTICFHPVARLRSRFRRDHIAVLGSGERAASIASFFADRKEKVTLHTGSTEAEQDGVLILPHGFDDSSELLNRSLKGSKRIIIAEKDDAQTVSEALGLSKKHSETDIFAVLNDPWMIKHTRSLKPGENATTGDLIYPVAWPCATARAVVAKHPPFLLAAEQDQQRIHVFFIGFGDLGASIVEDILNSSIIADWKPPKFTVVHPQALHQVEAFMNRRPGLRDLKGPDNEPHSLFNPINSPFSGLSNVQNDEEVLKAYSGQSITICYICDDDQTQALKQAMHLRDILKRAGEPRAPILVYLRDAFEIAPQSSGPILKPDTLTAFGKLEHTILASGMTDKDPDGPAERHHMTYIDMELGLEASKEWPILGESFRQSNRRAVFHVLAKLHSVGIDVKKFLIDQKSPTKKRKNEAQSDPAFLRPNFLPTPNREDFKQLKAALDPGDRLAELEHQRWIMDRYLDGWTFGPTRDRDLKTRPDMVDYHKLDEDTKTIDEKLVNWLLTELKSDNRNG